MLMRKYPPSQWDYFGRCLTAGIIFLKITEMQSGNKKTTPLLRLPDGTHAMMLYTSKTHPDLSDTFAGGRIEDAAPCRI